ncbi:MAG: hypothetical protein EOO65_02610 [Methanosarcinales archaeon]|nr:MAG: hypothetical protein EOO65_02610 [Methanosarcinales archaeon]
MVGMCARARWLIAAKLTAAAAGVPQPAGQWEKPFAHGHNDHTFVHSACGVAFGGAREAAVRLRAARRVCAEEQ